MLESEFQVKIRNEIEKRLPGSIVIKNDAGYIQGFPDLTVLYKKRWAILECKKSLNEPYQPNQEYYLEMLDDMSFAAMICPENKEDVLYELQRALSSRRAARVSLCK